MKQCHLDGACSLPYRASALQEGVSLLKSRLCSYLRGKGLAKEHKFSDIVRSVTSKKDVSGYAQKLLKGTKH